MKQYKEQLQTILDKGKQRGDRTGTGTISYFGLRSEYDLSEGFPLVTTKDMSERLEAIITELFWFLKGDTHLRFLVENGVGVWDADAHRIYKNATGSDMTLKEFKKRIREDEAFLTEVGELGPVYGAQWRSWGEAGIDQIADVISQIKNNPESRRMLVSAWNVEDLGKMALPPCHVLFQFYVEDGKLHCQLYQRSADMFLGVPFNIASYALLTMMMAKVCGLEAGRFIHILGDAHIYLNHLEQVELLLSREEYPLPKMHIDYYGQAIDQFNIEDFHLRNYTSHPEIKGKISVGN